jgi:hypothetical protein
MDAKFPLKNFLELSYETLEEMNLAAKQKQTTIDPQKLESKR